jgi:hypothetical protein
MFNIDVTDRAEQEILHTLDTAPPAFNGDRYVGIHLRMVDDQPKVSYTYHFLGAQNHITGKSLQVGITLVGNTLTDFDNHIIDWDGVDFIVSKNV